MHSEVPLLQTEPLGKPADDVGIDFIDKLLTKVVLILSAVIKVPIIIEQSQLFVLL
jgi:hypothetical protein